MWNNRRSEDATTISWSPLMTCSLIHTMTHTVTMELDLLLCWTPILHLFAKNRFCRLDPHKKASEVIIGKIYSFQCALRIWAGLKKHKLHCFSAHSDIGTTLCSQWYPCITCPNTSSRVPQAPKLLWVTNPTLNTSKLITDSAVAETNSSQPFIRTPWFPGNLNVEIVAS